VAPKTPGLQPLFLGSAALFLFALNRQSVDPGFLEREEAKLLFNFAALEGYEIPVVETALLLSRRALWYDSALLVVLDQGLALAPFLLSRRGAMIDAVLGTVLVATASLMAVSRTCAVRRGYPRFQIPGGLLAIGAGILLQNLSLPLERPWLPLLVAGLWIGANGVHGWSCDYIGKQPMSAAFLAPAWVAAVRLEDFVRMPTRNLRLAACAAAAPLLAAVGAMALARQAMIHRPEAFMLRTAAVCPRRPRS
jgi:hypothetical protein